jgi:hypothetical protein
VNNAIARVAGLIAIAVLPVAAGIRAGPGQPLGPRFSLAMTITAAVCVTGGITAALTIRAGADVHTRCSRESTTPAKTRPPDARALLGTRPRLGFTEQGD